MECDEERDAETEDDERNEEVTVGEDGSGLVEEFHGRGTGWDNRKDGAGWVSRMGVGGARAGRSRLLFTRMPVSHTTHPGSNTEDTLG